LADLRVVDVTTGIAGAYCTKLLAEAGADVVKVEPPAGDPWRAWSASGAKVDVVAGSPLFRFLHHGKRSVVALASDDAVLARLGKADVLVVGAASDLTAAVEHAVCADRTVRLSITPYGTSGPFAWRSSTEFTVQADAGSLLARGRAGCEPIQASGRVVEWVAGTFGAVAVGAALREAQRSGRGERIDLSLAEVGVLATSQYSQVKHSLLGNPTFDTPYRSFETPSIEPTRDGYVGFTTNSREQFDNFLLLIERPDLLGDEDLASAAGRQRRWDEWNAIVHAWMRDHATEDVVQRASELRVPVAPVNTGADVAAFPHLVERGVFGPDPTGEFTMPRRPWLIDGEPVPPPRGAPMLGEHTATLPPASETRPAREPGAATRLPLDGIRVLDLTNWWAGPFGTGVLAALGADVIHVESPTHLDGMRSTGGRITTEGRWWELSPHFLCANANKRDLVLDLRSDEGEAIAWRIIERCDLVMENFTPRVLERFGLSWDAIHARNPRCSLVRMPAFGLSGPWRDHTGFAQTMEQLSGIAWMTGHRDDQPRVQGGPSDPNAGLHGALGALLALARRDATGSGSFVESPMVESALNAAAELVIEYSAHGVVLERMGNRAPNVAPQGLYRCAGIDAWLAISVETDEQWRALRDALGNPEWSWDAELDTFEGRWRTHDELDVQLRAWARHRDGRATAEMLVARGVPAALARDPRALYDHPQFIARRFHEVFEHGVVGSRLATTLPFRFETVERWVRSPAPTFGEHNREVLCDVADLDDGAIAGLYARGVIADSPAR
jgi:crotonobetainyl-CoA:carnitine CoA-transferase CaiB-like acyl-CoA transferase